MKVKPDDDSPKAVAHDDSGDRYGWGTSIRLEPEQVKALGIDKLTAGQRVLVRAAAFVCSVAASAGDQDGDESAGGAEMSVGLQITDMEVSVLGRDASKDASKLYGEAK
ncbi:MAG: hypothetical protein PHW13_11900 [Methylococcales bacterium]|nr:hypothetical protein [Methylococcales bacterium]